MWSRRRILGLSKPLICCRTSPSQSSSPSSSESTGLPLRTSESTTRVDVVPLADQSKGTLVENASFV